MSTDTAYQASTLVFTERAATKVKSLIDEEENDALKLRVFVTGGGCAGFQYGFTFDELVAEMVQEDLKIAKRDEIVKDHGFTVMDYNE